MSTHNIHLKYRPSKRYPTIISIVPPSVALLVTFQGSNYRCHEQIFMVPKGFEPSKFDCTLLAMFLIYLYINFFKGNCRECYYFELFCLPSEK